MVHILSAQNSLVTEWVAELRNIEVQNDRMRFRRNLERIGEIAAYEISKHLMYEQQNLTTPMGIVQIPMLQQHPVVATILRAGVPLHHGVMNYFDKADAAFIAAYRKHHRDGSFEIAQNYITAPPIHGRDLIVADPMLATGASLVLSIEALKQNGQPKSLHIVTAIACTVGIEHVKRKIPEAQIWAAAVDDELTAKGYIVPGLGDAGDLAYGSKTQN